MQGAPKVRYTIAKFLNGPLEGTERVVENPKQTIVVTDCESSTYIPLPHIFVDQNYTYYTLERKHTTRDSPTDSADITRNISSD